MRAFFESLWSGRPDIALLFTPFSLLYSLGWRTYAWLYSSGLKMASRPHSPVVVVGNLTAGGSGKTPFTLWLAAELTKRGRNVVLGMSGYGSPHADGATETPVGQLSALAWGDEPAMARWLMPDLAIIVGRDRVKAAELAHVAFPGHVLLMDDGFQHLRLATDIRLVIDPDEPNGFCFPAGPYREPKRVGHRRATKVLRYGQDLLRLPTTFFGPTGTPAALPERANMLCAIANPWRFHEALHEAGMELLKGDTRADHDSLQAGSLLSQFEPEVPLVVTAKDFVKLRERGDIEGRKVVVGDYRVVPVDESGFLDWLEGKIDEVMA